MAALHSLSTAATIARAVPKSQSLSFSCANPAPSTPGLLSLPALDFKKQQKLRFRIHCNTTTIKIATAAATSSSEFEHERIMCPRPTEIAWKKELANSVNLIGIVATPVQIKPLSSGKVLAWTRLAVKKSSTDTIWINLTFWDQLAHVAFQHVEKGQQIYVCGRLVSDTVDLDNERTQTYYKVVVQQLNFVEKIAAPVSLYEPDTSSTATGGKVENFSGNRGGSTEELWQAFFANPVDWWDNRRNKRNPKYPDFKHKHTGEALWIEGKYSPQWVKSQLAILDAQKKSLHAKHTTMPVSFMSSDDLSLF